MKTDSAPIRGDGYESKFLKFRLRANAETSHSVRYDLVVVVGIMGGGERFLHGIVRSRKLLLSAPYKQQQYYSPIKAPIQSNMDTRHLIIPPNPQ